ncbi:MAG: phosphatidate cytidylyltransferase [Moorellales bacterium]
MNRRVLTALAGIPLILLLAYLGKGAWLTAVMVLHLLATRESKRLGLVPKETVTTGLAYLAVPLFELWAYGRGLQGWTHSLLVVFAVTTLAYILRYPRSSLASWSTEFLTITYLGLFCFLVMLERVKGWPYLWMLLFTVWANDTVAYYSGSRFGRRALAPAVSPRKTWEGAISGLAAAAIVGAGAAYYWFGQAGLGAVLGLAVAAAAQLGDLWESALKRQSGVKDTGNLLPGHGGVLDRFDSLLFAAPLGFYLVQFLKL